MIYELSKDLSQLFVTATKACRGFYILGDLEGTDKFVESLKKNLHENGWPIAPFEHGHTYKAEELKNYPMNQFIEEGIANTPLSRESDRQHSFSVWSRNLSSEERAFIVSPEAPAILEKSIKAAVEESSLVHGDPFAVKYRQGTSVLAAIFGTAARKLGFGANKPEEKLISLTKETRKTIKHYQDQHDVPFEEMRDRVAAELIKDGWPADTYGRLPSNYSHLLGDLIQPAKTTLIARFSLQNSSVPPQKFFGKAKDFIIARAKDIPKAVAKVAKDLDAEIASPGGFVTHYLIMNGHRHVPLDKPGA